MAAVRLREGVGEELQGRQRLVGEVEVPRQGQRPRGVAAGEGEEAQHLVVVEVEEQMGSRWLQARSRLGERQLLGEGVEGRRGFPGLG